MEIDLIKLLEKIKPTEKGVRLYCKFLENAYNKKLLKVNRIKRSSNDEIEKLSEMRKLLVEKNLAGTYSDEIFKEQNAVIEEKLKEAYASQNDELIDRYDINLITEFIQDKILNLPKTYSNSTLEQLRFLLSSIFDSGVSWSYPGYSNYKFSPVYQSIHDADKQSIPFGEPYRIRTCDQELKRLLLYR